MCCGACWHTHTARMHSIAVLSCWPAPRLKSLDATFAHREIGKEKETERWRWSEGWVTTVYLDCFFPWHTPTSPMLTFMYMGCRCCIKALTSQHIKSYWTPEPTHCFLMAGFLKMGKIFQLGNCL